MDQSETRMNIVQSFQWLQTFRNNTLVVYVTCIIRAQLCITFVDVRQSCVIKYMSTIQLSSFVLFDVFSDDVSFVQVILTIDVIDEYDTHDSCIVR
jgi:hypothetical protein